MRKKSEPVKSPQKPPKNASELNQTSNPINLTSKEKKSRKTQKKAKNDNVPESYSLFDDSDVVSAVVSNPDNNDDEAEKKVKTRKPKAASGTSGDIKKPGKDLQRAEKDVPDKPKANRGNKKHEDKSSETDRQVADKQRVKADKGKPGKDGKRETARGGKTGNPETDVHGSKPKVSGGDEPSGGRDKEVKEKTKVKENKLKKSDIVGFKLTEFPESGSVMGAVDIQIGPVETNHFDVVEIVLNNLRYRVSPWSIKNGKYIQGLDSRFLLKKYKPKKK